MQVWSGQHIADVVPQFARVVLLEPFGVASLDRGRRKDEVNSVGPQMATLPSDTLCIRLIYGVGHYLHITRISKVDIQLGVPQYENAEIRPKPDKEWDPPARDVEVATFTPF